MRDWRTGQSPFMNCSKVLFCPRLKFAFITCKDRILLKATEGDLYNSSQMKANLYDSFNPNSRSMIALKTTFYWWLLRVETLRLILSLSNYSTTGIKCWKRTIFIYFLKGLIDYVSYPMISERVWKWANSLSV